MLKKIVNKIPEFCLSHWLLRIPLAILFLQQGLTKLPFSVEDAIAMDLPSLVWFFVVFGEVGAGLGLLFGGLWGLKFFNDFIQALGDMTTRFSGIVMCCIMTGVIWLSEPTSLMDVLLYDNYHALLWVGGLFFALRGNRG